MSEKITRLSAGVKANEIDLSAVTAPPPVTPEGVPAGVIGTAKSGPAFVPVTVPNSSELISIFGDSKGDEFGPIALREWLKNSSAGTYIRVLGAGDGKEKAGDGIVTNAGFVVGDKQVQVDGDIGNNPYANGSTPIQTTSRTYFVGTLMSESLGSTYLSDAGLQEVKSVPILRGVIFAPQGINLKIKSHSSFSTIALATAPAASDDATIDGPVGCSTGSVENGHQSTLFLNGLKSDDANERAIQFSFDPDSPQYLSNVLNTDPLKIEEKGHYLYADYPVYRSQAIVTGSGCLVPGDYSLTGEPIAFLLTGSNSRAAGSETQPDFETFSNRYQNSFSPMFISQDMGTRHNLFKVSSKE